MLGRLRSVGRCFVMVPLHDTAVMSQSEPPEGPREQAAPSQMAGVSHQVSPRPTRPRASARIHVPPAPHPRAELRWRAFARLAEDTPPLYKAFTWAEEKAKRQLFGCRMCAQCALPTTAYACPQTCPKQLRNGPCGGVFPDGSCEVYPDMSCVWVTAYERAEQTGHVEDLRRLVRPIDHQKWGQSSWINFWSGRDERPLDRRQRPGQRTTHVAQRRCAAPREPVPE